MTYGENIRQLRTARNMTQTQLGKAAGTTAAAISNYELDLRRPTRKTEKAIARALGIPMYELYQCYEDENNDNSMEQTIHWVSDIRARRLKRITAAFDKLSDKGQMELIKRAEELTQISTYTH